MVHDRPQRQSALPWPNPRNSGLVNQKDFCCRKILLLLRKVKVLRQERTNLLKAKGIYCKWDTLPDGGHESFCTQQASSLWGAADQKKQGGMLGKFIMRHANRKFPKEEQIEWTVKNFSSTGLFVCFFSDNLFPDHRSLARKSSQKS